jgi:hypothetical protein
LNEQVIREPRLEKKLGVDGFRLPPVGEEFTGKRDAKGKPEKKARQVPAVRFPNWHFCPSCDLLQPTRLWNYEMGRPELFCSACSGQPGKPKKQFVVPVRFVVACENGHLGEFPWSRWCNHNAGCERKKQLKLVTIGAGLRGLYVVCTNCGGKNSMGTAFSQTAMARIGHSCSGKSPWLPKEAEVCAKPPLVIQRGASNVYFPIIESAIDIPPWGDTFQEALGDHWKRLKRIDDASKIRDYVENWILEDWDGPSMSIDEMVAKIELRLQLIEGVDTENLRVEEYAHLTSGEMTDERGDAPSFQIHPEPVPHLLGTHIRHLVRVERLREVRALRGFTRLTPMSGEETDRQIAPLSIAPKKWLPAIEVHGEGIFIGLDERRLASWEELNCVQKRVRKLEKTALLDWQERNGDERPFPLDLSARFVLIHTLAHAFIRQLSLECGYSSASVRERLYVDRGEKPMSGFLVYTSAPDADGTLGGLSRQGRPERVVGTLIEAVRDLEWCSSDPLCSDGLASLSDNANLAASHSCTFLPETACEHFNRYLDRSLIVGTPDAYELGFFRDLIV